MIRLNWSSSANTAAVDELSVPRVQVSPRHGISADADSKILFEPYVLEKVKGSQSILLHTHWVFASSTRCFGEKETRRKKIKGTDRDQHLCLARIQREIVITDILTIVRVQGCFSATNGGHTLQLQRWVSSYKSR